MNKFRFAIRILLKRPLSMAVAVLTLALLLGAVTLGLGVYQHEKSAWMPFPESERLVRFWQSTGASGSFTDNILKLILRYGVVLGCAGIAVGSLIAAFVTVGISKNFFGVGWVDPLTYLFVAGLMFSTTLAASFLPALRATRVNPVEVLRSA